MRGGARLLAIMWSLAVIGLGVFFAVVGGATRWLGNTDRFAAWLSFGVVLIVIGLILLVVTWRRGR